MKKYRVEMASQAIEGVTQFLDYIALVQQAPLNAERWWRKASKAIESLRFFPHRCPIAPENEFRDYEVRALIVAPCLFLFHIDDANASVRVIGFRHGRQLPAKETLPDSPA